jgi:hypothetical protein
MIDHVTKEKQRKKKKTVKRLVSTHFRMLHLRSTQECGIHHGGNQNP